MQMKREREKGSRFWKWLDYFNFVDCVILKKDFRFEFLFLYLTELVVYTRWFEILIFLDWKIFFFKDKISKQNIEKISSFQFQTDESILLDSYTVFMF